MQLCIIPAGRAKKLVARRASRNAFRLMEEFDQSVSARVQNGDLEIEAPQYCSISSAEPTWQNNVCGLPSAVTLRIGKVGARQKLLP